MGGMRWELVGCLILAWLIVFTVLIKGVKSLGKAVWFTALFPYLILSILLCFGLSLDGAMDGIRYYVTPNLSRLWDIQVEWLTVCWMAGAPLSVPRSGLMQPCRYSSPWDHAGAHSSHSPPTTSSTTTPCVMLSLSPQPTVSPASSLALWFSASLGSWLTQSTRISRM